MMKQHYRYGLIASIYLVINGLFIIKYGYGFTPVSSYLLAASYMVTAVLFLQIIRWIDSRFSLTNRNLAICLTITLIIFTGLSLLLLHRIDPTQVNVDRWSAIHNFLDYLFEGRYPYDALTQHGQYASPFPIWIFLHIPFYSLGDVGYAQIFFFILTTLAIVYFTKNIKLALLFCLLMLASPAFWYEVAVRSDFMSNMMAILTTILYIKTKKKTFETNPVMLSIIVGLALSTRLIVILPLAVTLFSDFWELHKNKMKLVKVIIIVGTTFLITFLPFILWDIQRLAFLHHNPFILQTNKLSIWVVLLFGAVAVALSFKVKGSKAVIEEIALLLAGMMAIYLLQNWIEDGWSIIIFHDAIDLAYISCALPFISLGFASNDVNS